MRRRTISIDCATASRARRRSADGDSVTAIRPSGRVDTANSFGVVLGSAARVATARSCSEGARGVKVTAPRDRSEPRLR